jgi:hypothetical protein
MNPLKRWAASGLAPDAFTMEGLAGKVKTPTVFLLMLAGLIMAVTLWTSKKARSVIKTSVDLESTRGRL